MKSERSHRLCDDTMRQFELEDRTPPDCRRSPDATLVALDDGLADGKTHSHPLCLGGDERLENIPHVRRVNSPAIILDRHVHQTRMREAGGDAKHTHLHT